MSEQSAKMTYRLSDGTETTYLVELQPESDNSIMDKKFYLAGVEAERERIIKLLEDNRYLCSTEKACWENLDSGCECPELIALIKGEK